MLDVFVHDPLWDWVLTAEKMRKIQEDLEEEKDNGAQASSETQVDCVPGGMSLICILDELRAMLAGRMSSR